MKLNRLTLLFITFIILLDLRATQLPKKESLKIPMSYIPKFDKYLGNEVENNKVFHNISNGLVRLNKNLKPVPDLASWIVNMKHSYIEFVLKDVRFTDGEKLRTAHIKENFIGAISNDSPITKMIKSKKSFFVKMSRNRFRVYLKNSSMIPVFIRTLSSPSLLITKQGLKGQPIGTGNYEIKLINKKRVLLKSAKKNSRFSEILLQVESYTKSFGNLLKNNFNESFNIADINNKKHPSKTFNIGALALVLNTNSKCLRDVKNRRLLRDYIYNNPIWKKYTNLSKAQTLVPQGYVGHHPSFSIKKLNKNATLQNCNLRVGLREKYKGSNQLQYLETMLKSLKIEYKITFESFADVLKKMRNNQIDMTLKIDTPNDGDPTKSFISYFKGAKQNISHYSNKKLDALLIDYRSKTSLKQREIIIQKMNTLIYSESPVIPIHAFNVTRYNNINNKDNNYKDYRFWNYNYDMY